MRFPELETWDADDVDRALSWMILTVEDGTIAWEENRVLKNNPYPWGAVVDSNPIEEGTYQRGPW
jgi:hypothetical protein